MSRSRVRWAAQSSTHVVQKHATGVALSPLSTTPTRKQFRLSVESWGFCRSGQCGQVAATGCSRRNLELTLNHLTETQRRENLPTRVWHRDSDRRVDGHEPLSRLAQLRRQCVAIGGGDSGRPNEHSGYRGAIRRPRPKEVGGQ